MDVPDSTITALMLQRAQDYVNFLSGTVIPWQKHKLDEALRPVNHHGYTINRRLMEMLEVETGACDCDGILGSCWWLYSALFVRSNLDGMLKRLITDPSSPLSRNGIVTELVRFIRREDCPREENYKALVTAIARFIGGIASGEITEADFKSA